MVFFSLNYWLMISRRSHQLLLELSALSQPDLTTDREDQSQIATDIERRPASRRTRRARAPVSRQQAASGRARRASSSGRLAPAFGGATRRRRHEQQGLRVRPAGCEHPAVGSHQPSPAVRHLHHRLRLVLAQFHFQRVGEVPVDVGAAHVGERAETLLERSGRDAQQVDARGPGGRQPDVGHAHVLGRGGQDATYGEHVAGAQPRRTRRRAPRRARRRRSRPAVVGLATGARLCGAGGCARPSAPRCPGLPGEGCPEQTHLGFEHDVEATLHGLPHHAHEDRVRRRTVASPTLVMKLACTGETSAPPRRTPLTPAASSKRPAESPGGFLNVLPKVRTPRGWRPAAQAQERAVCRQNGLALARAQMQPHSRHHARRRQPT